MTSICTCVFAAGQDEFDTIVRTYFRGAGAAVLAFSTTDRESFDAIRRWKERVESECGDIALVLVQNKVSCQVTQELSKQRWPQHVLL